MSDIVETLMELNSPIEENFRLTPGQKKALKKIGIETMRDLLFYFPSRYESFSERKNIIDLKEGDKTTVFGKIIKTKTEKTWRKKINLSEITISDLTGAIKATWFNQPYIAKTLKEGDKVALTGKMTRGKSGLYIANPNYEKITSYEALGEGGEILAIYPESAGVTSRWLRYAIKKILRSLKAWPNDPLPKEVLKR
ncbi:MAG: OB-fold nucleic acid binding domain-containing protein, partial [Patescibacteria group bacterium]